MADLDDIKEHYADLLIMQYHSQQKARETVKNGVDIYSGDGVVLQLENILDIDSAVGKQLDLIGKILDCPRIIPGLVTDVDFFSFEKENALGFSTIGTPSQGYFKDITLDYRSTYSLLDDEYRQLLKFKAVANRARASWKDLDELFYKIFYLGKIFNKSLFTTIGSPIITVDGIYSNTTQYQGIKTNFYASNLINKSWEISENINFNGNLGNTLFGFVKEPGGFVSNAEFSNVYCKNNYFKHCFYCGTEDEKTRFWANMNLDYSKLVDYLEQTLRIKLSFDIETGVYELSANTLDDTKITSDTFTPTTTNKQLTEILSGNNLLRVGGIGGDITIKDNVQIDLKTLVVTVNGKEVFSGAKEQSAIDVVNNKDLSITYNIKKDYLNNAIKACIQLGYFESPIGIGYNINYI